MKKPFSLMLLLAMMLAFTACGDDKDEPGISISKDQLVGVWDAIAVQFNNDGKWIDITSRLDLAMSIYFYENGDYYGEGALGTGEGTYTLKGNVIKTYIDGQLYATYVINSLVGDIAELSITMGNESMLIRAKKSKLSFKPNDGSLTVTTTTSDGGIYWLCWTSELLDGNHYVYQTLRFTYWDLTWRIDDYTLNDKGVWNVTINGESFRATMNNQSIINYDYSYVDNILVLRNKKTKEEKVYTAIVSDNTLTLSDGTNVEIYTKEQ